MKTWKHINYEQRKTISSCISHDYKLINISKILDLDPRSISREVKRNREIINYQKTNSVHCEKLNRWPYVYANCKLRYKNCPFTQYKYVASTAQKKANANLINSRKGIDIDSEEFKKLDLIIKSGIDDNKSIYQIKIENNDAIDKSITILYKYINNGYLTTKRIDLPYQKKKTK